MKIVLLEEAQRLFEAEETWWRNNRDSKDLFVEEFEQALKQLSSMPEAARHYRRVRGKAIQRVLMEKTRHRSWSHASWYHRRYGRLSTHCLTGTSGNT